MAKLTINQALRQGVEAHKAGQLQKADRLYNAILKVQPKHPDANHNMGVLTVAAGKNELALPFFRTALEVNSSKAQFWYSYIDALIRLDRLVDAKAVLDQAGNKGAKDGGFKQLEQRLNDSAKVQNKSNNIVPNEYRDQFNILDTQNLNQALILAKNKANEDHPEEAKRIYQDIMLKFPGNKKASLGLKRLSGGSIKQESKVQDPPQNQQQSLINLHSQGQFQQALEQTKTLLKQFPSSSVLHNICGAIYLGLGQMDASIKSYNQALCIKPDYADAHYNMATALQDQGKLEEAIEAYSKALAFNLDHADAHNNMGTALQEQGKHEEAVEAYSKSLAIKPDYAEAYFNMGNALKAQGKLEEAIEAYSKSLTIKPGYANSRTQKLYQQALTCDWDSIAEDFNLIPELGTTENYVSPFLLLSLEDAPDRHLSRSEIYAKAKYPQKILRPKARPSKRPKRIRIGYFSTDFKEHPVAYLIAKVLKQHNHDQFEVFGYSVHGSSSCEMRQRLEKSFDSFKDVQSMSDRDIAQQARYDEIDIAIDLNGYTQNARTGIFAYRAAPIQINYLGYPGTMGSNFMDYIVADKSLIPVENQKYFNEKQLYLPHTYLPTDDSRELSKKKITRGDMRLPDNAFVFCCFNNNYKISPTEFDIWMRLLTKVENSVLWLRQSNQFSIKNLKNEAQKRNVDPSRLVFANKAPIDEHLARQRLADLFVDTFSFNAHSTAADALWAGLPVVTKLGLGFAARVAGSLLNAVGLPELVTDTEQDYEALILELATNSTKLAKIKEKLATNRLSQPLFNTKLYTKHLENGFHQAYQNYFDGNPPQTIIVPK
jgi:protein O-GlcNAc transferase